MRRALKRTCKILYCIVGFSRYLNSTNFAAIDRFVTFKFEKLNNNIKYHQTATIQEKHLCKKHEKTEDQAFAEFKYLENQLYDKSSCTIVIWLNKCL